MKKSFKESSKSGALVWLWQRITAVVLFILLMVHYITYHFISSGGVTYQQVMDKMQSPWFNLIQFLFLITALYHGLNGVWMVTEDYIHCKAWRLIIHSLIVLVGVSLLFVGTFTIFSIAG